MVPPPRHPDARRHPRLCVHEGRRRSLACARHDGNEAPAPMGQCLRRSLLQAQQIVPVRHDGAGLWTKTFKEVLTEAGWDPPRTAG